MEYKNEICQGCGKKFAENDDIVVCPECGTPQHRECYEKEHKCVNEHLHAEHYEWKPKHSDIPEQAAVNNSGSKRVCPFCGHENDPDAKICENCGQPFELFGRSIFPDEAQSDSQSYEYKPPFDVGDFKPDENGYRASESQNGGSYQSAPNGAFGFSDDIPDGETDGVKNSDIKMFVRTSVGRYYRKFKSIEAKKPTFNWGALIFGYLWFFFRKMFKSGIAFLTVELCLVFAFYNPVMTVYNSMADATASIRQAESETQAAEIAEEANKVLDENKTAICIFFGATLLSRLVAALIADRLYKKKVTKDIKVINERADGDDRAKLAEYFKKGGSSFMTAFIGYFLRYAITLIVTGVFFE